MRFAERAWIVLPFLSLALVPGVRAQEDGDEEWEAWVAKVAEPLEFPDREVVAFKADGKAYMVARARAGAEDGKGAYFAIRALTKFPDTTRLEACVVFHGQQKAWTQAEVARGVAVFVIGPLGPTRVLAGEYQVQVAFFPHRQRQRVLDFPGVPVEEVRVETRATVGDAARLAAERDERRGYYQDYMKRILVLESEEARNVDAALMREKYILGRDESTFDVAAWRRWLGDWRERMADQIGEGMRQECEGDVLAMRYHEAYTILQSIVALDMIGNKARSRLVYQGFGRAIHPDDEVGVDDIGLPTIESKVRELRQRFDEFAWE